MAVDPAGARHALISFEDPDLAKAFATGCEVKILGYRPHNRAVIAYTPARGEDGNTVIGKLYRSASKAKRVWQTMRALHAGADSAWPGIPRPLALAEGHGLLLMTRLSGPSLREVLDAEPTVTRAGALGREAAEALTGLHAAPADGLRLKVKTLAAAAARVREQAEHVAQVAPLLARDIEGLLDGHARAVREAAWGECRLLHGDCTLRHFLQHAGGVAVLDFDRFCLGDPALDIGYFMAEAHADAVRTGRAELRVLAASFLAEYEGRCGERSLADRARVVQGVVLLSYALRRFRTGPLDFALEASSSLPARLVQEAAGCFARL